jgi:hypothetical protein
MENDTWEMHDLSSGPAIATAKEGLMQRLLRYQMELGDPLDLDIANKV